MQVRRRNGRAPHASGWALRAPCPRPCRRPLWMDPPQTASRAPHRSLAAAPLPSGKQPPATRSPLIKRARAQATRMLSQPVRTPPASLQACFRRSWLAKAALHGYHHSAGPCSHRCSTDTGSRQLPTHSSAHASVGAVLWQPWEGILQRLALCIERLVGQPCSSDTQAAGVYLHGGACAPVGAVL